MRLLTHNSMQSPLSQSSPLVVACTSLNYRPSSGPCSKDVPEADSQEQVPDLSFVERLIADERLNYAVFYDAYKAILPSLPSHIDPLPESLPANVLDSRSLLTALHSVLLDCHIMEGTLTDSKTGRVFKITNGIPNLMLMEDEIESVEKAKEAVRAGTKSSSSAKQNPEAEVQNK